MCQCVGKDLYSWIQGTFLIVGESNCGGACDVDEIVKNESDCEGACGVDEIAENDLALDISSSLVVSLFVIVYISRLKLFIIA